MTKFVNFPSIGYLETKVPDHLFQKMVTAAYLNQERNNITSKDSIAGHIEETYNLSLDKKDFNEVEDFVLDQCQKYVDEYDIFRFMKSLPSTVVPLELKSIWSVFQKKHEYNPVHNHAGVFSFVIWVKIPYNLEDEYKHESVSKSCYKVGSLFSFHYTNSLGRVEDHLIEVDKSYEGTMILFPAELAHGVYPFFTSDETRISIAGNVGLASYD